MTLTRPVSLGWRGGAALAVFTLASVSLGSVGHALEPITPSSAPITSSSLLLASVPQEGVIDFAVMRDGARIGHHRVTFTPRGDELIVDIDIRLDVTIAFINFYDYHHRNREVWRAGELVGFESTTDDNGKPNQVEVARDGADVRVKGTAFNGLTAANILPTSYWNPATIRAQSLINTQNGKVAQVAIADLGDDRIEAAGRQIDARHYRISGDVHVDLWYDRNGMWVKTAFNAPGDDTLITYELMGVTTPGATSATTTTAVREGSGASQP